jgi:hypothetical protein
VFESLPEIVVSANGAKIGGTMAVRGDTTFCIAFIVNSITSFSTGTGHISFHQVHTADNQASNDAIVRLRIFIVANPLYRRRLRNAVLNS